MKKLILIFTILLFSTPAISSPIVENPMPADDTQTLQCEITFDWITKTQMQRDENITQIRDILFNEKTVNKYPKKEFKSMYANFWKDKDYLKNYEDISKGKKEDEKAYYCAFNLGNTNLLLAYGIQYKNDLHHIYYYDALGRLYCVDVLSESYPEFPCWSYQYGNNGELKAAYYYNSDYDQYAYDANKSFRGRWYKEKMYNRKAKVIMTRSNY